MEISKQPPGGFKRNQVTNQCQKETEKEMAENSMPQDKNLVNKDHNLLKFQVTRLCLTEDSYWRLVKTYGNKTLGSPQSVRLMAYTRGRQPAAREPHVALLM
ncbi:hypothetical protein AVEN_141981-1 [Araneus ventricosus]|uniref:Uncharacterized protein n=1 Tax=Araneus ventricosus TaxID=182803 RepID=A0A4Y2N5B1_ARAVE|nr:hypothetical protein AVEN_141981-1 [Araneus ventricosus]